MSPNSDNNPVRKTRTKIRIQSLILDNIYGSLIALAFTGILLFGIYQGYLSIRDTAYFTWIVRILLTVFVVGLVFLLVVLIFNVGSFLLRGAAENAKDAAKNIAEGREEVDPEFRFKRQSVKLYLDQQRRGELPSGSGPVVEGSVREIDDGR